MRICIIGTGYVGLVSGACLADVGNIVWCVDRDKTKIECLNRNEIPIYEPGLDRIVLRNAADKRLFFSTDLSECLNLSDICIIAVDTPLGDDGLPDLTSVYAVARQVGEALDHSVIVIVKSTV